jgi:hypothetical protein
LRKNLLEVWNRQQVRKHGHGGHRRAPPQQGLHRSTSRAKMVPNYTIVDSLATQSLESRQKRRNVAAQRALQLAMKEAVDLNSAERRAPLEELDRGAADMVSEDVGRFVRHLVHHGRMIVVVLKHGYRENHSIELLYSTLAIVECKTDEERMTSFGTSDVESGTADRALGLDSSEIMNTGHNGHERDPILYPCFRVSRRKWRRCLAGSISSQ